MEINCADKIIKMFARTQLANRKIYRPQLCVSSTFNIAARRCTCDCVRVCVCVCVLERAAADVGVCVYAYVCVAVFPFFRFGFIKINFIFRIFRFKYAANVNE